AACDRDEEVPHATNPADPGRLPVPRDLRERRSRPTAEGGAVPEGRPHRWAARLVPAPGSFSSSRKLPGRAPAGPWAMNRSFLADHEGADLDLAPPARRLDHPSVSGRDRKEAAVHRPGMWGVPPQTRAPAKAVPQTGRTVTLANNAKMAA